MYRHAAGAGLLLALACVRCDAGVLGAGPATPRPLAPDLALTIQARGMLLRDPELAPLNVGVRVRNGIATLWGPVPSAETAFKAEICLRGLVELLEVRNELHVTGEPTAPPGDAPRAFLLPEVPPALPALPQGVIPPPPPVRAIAEPFQPQPVTDDVDLPPLRLPQPKQ